MDKFSILIAISLIAFSSQRVGSFVKDSFASNDIRIDRARRTIEKEYFKMSQLAEEEVDLFPIAIYKQLVNGINYKVFFGALQKSTNELKLFDYVVYSGPFTQSEDPFKFELTSSKELENDLSVALRKYNYDQIKDIIKAQLELEGNSLVDFTVLRSQIDVLGTASIYVVKVQTEKNEKPDNFVIFQDEDGNFEMVANWAN